MINSISALQNLTNLQELNLNHNNGQGEINDISALATMTGLQSLDLFGNKITDISVLENMTSLTRLQFGNPIEVAHALVVVPTLTNLESLSIGYIPLTNVDLPVLLNGLTKLTRFEHWDNRSGDGQISDISAFAAVTSLTELKLGGMSISDLTPLAGMTQLRELDLRDNFVENLSPLAGLSGLEVLLLTSNQISDISALENLTSLNDLQLGNNRIGDISVLDKLTGLSNVTLEGNLLGETALPIIGALQNSGITVGHDYIPSGGVFIPDINLRSALEISIYNHAVDKITGPWLWLLAPTQSNGPDAVNSGTDFLSDGSGGTVTEINVATGGVIAGDSVGGQTWVEANISPVDDDNLNTLANDIGFIQGGQVNQHVAYGYIKLESQTLQQNVLMSVGSDDSIRVWLNGSLVHENPASRGANDYQESFEIDLQAGENHLVVAVYQGGGGWSGFFGIDADFSADGIAYQASGTPKPTNGQRAISQSELETLTTLQAGNRGIKDLTGLESCINLEWLGLWSNQISAISALANLTDLAYLNLGGNQVSDI